MQASLSPSGFAFCKPRKRGVWVAYPAGEGAKLIASLAEEPGITRLVGPGSVVLVWSLDGMRLLWASDNAGPWARGNAELDVVRIAGGATAARLRELGAGLSPRTGYRLERLRLGIGSLERPATYACRIVPFGDGEALMMTPLGAWTAEPVAGITGLPSGAHPVETSRDNPSSAGPQERRGHRFTWQTDSEHRFVAVSPELAEGVGSKHAAILGRRWSELLGRVVLDERGAVARAFASAGPWSRLPVLWRDVERDRVVPVEISGMPARDDEGLGYRGFGVAYPEEAGPVPSGRFGEPLTVVSAHTETRSREPRSLGFSDAVQAAAALTGTAGDTVFGVLQAWFTPQAIEQKRPPSAAAAADRSPAVARAAQDVAAPAGPSGLSPSERGALHEIARALSVDDGEPEGGVRPTAEIVALPLPRARDLESVRILERLPIGILVLRDGTPLFANRTILELTGHDDLPGLVARGGLRSLFGRGFEGIYAAGPAPVEIRSGGGGALLPFEMRVEPIAWGDLPATLVSLVAATDAEPRQRARALELDLVGRDRRLSELAATVELAADGVVTVDASGRIVWMSRSAENLFGFQANEVTGDAVTALVLPDDHRATLACIEAVGRREIGAVEECEIRGRARGGSAVPLSMRVGRVADPLGTAFSVAFRNVSRFKAMEDELREARSAAERASGNRAEFLARVSHEIRTPLTAITGFAELILEERFGPVGSERYKGYIRDIHDSGGHVISLVNDLLDLAKVTSGQSDLRPTSLDLNVIAQQCIALAGPIAARERTILRTSFAAGLPRTYADERSVRQIVLNVMSNAIRFTGAGGQVIVSTTRGGSGDVILRVRDTGPGMSRDDIEAALTPFRQVPATRRGDGTGLGLPLSKALVEANRGAFAVLSEPNSGTLIEIRLPAAAPVSEAMAAE